MPTVIVYNQRRTKQFQSRGVVDRMEMRCSLYQK